MRTLSQNSGGCEAPVTAKTLFRANKSPIRHRAAHGPPVPIVRLFSLFLRALYRFRSMLMESLCKCWRKSQFHFQISCSGR